MKARQLFTVLLAVQFCLETIVSAEPPARKSADVEFKRIGEQSLKLDVYLPEQRPTLSPLIVWIHGGGWREGNKGGVPILPFLSSGFAVASVEYRLSGQAAFPAQIEDVKAAIRWLRAHGREYRIDPEHIGVIGHSAGGHLASLVGTTGKDSPFDVGENLEFPSVVQAVCVMSGPSDMVAMFDGADERRRSALVGLLGGSLAEKRTLAETASPLSYVRPGLPPFLFVHGADDQVVPVQQAKTMILKLQKIGATPKTLILPQTGHDVFVQRQQYVEDVRAFFTTHLVKK